ncbi:Epimerase domain-containing protein [Mycena venus]|uniref:Epimerase domain-containing protein n=1 Tax=Mycena venus TaxID=2733690 RepID=A0A8H6XPQ3_9AGAR|nr:Epimerase domain-containing protein [Mycena venus]
MVSTRNPVAGATCPALIPPQNLPCGKPVNVSKQHTWCLPHHKAERKHYHTYKRFSDELDNFDHSSVCTDLNYIKSCGISETLSCWATHLRRKLSLYDKVIRGREYHHWRFYGGGDPAHICYLEVLSAGRRETEVALLAVNRRHDELYGVTSSDPEDLDDEEVAAILGWDTAPPSDIIVPEEDPYADQFEEERRRERSRLIQQLFAFRKAALLHGEDTRAQFIDYMERIVILAMLERSGMRPLLHAGAKDVEDFLAQDIVTLDELKQIYVAVHLTTPQTIFSAINDAFRSADDPHDVVLGRRIYAEESNDEICFAAWDLFEDVMPCRHCALQGCQRLEEWTRIERLATLSLRFLNWQSEDVASFSRADTLFHLSGVFAERKWERFSPAPYKSKKHGNQWVQIERPAGLYLKLPLDNADTYHRFLHIIQSLKDHFSVLPWAPAFTEATGTLIPRAPTELCASRMRTAWTLEGLSYASWEETDTMHEREARELHATSRDPLVLHMIVLDRTNGTLARLKDNLALAFLFAEQLAGETPRAFVAAEMRKLLDGRAAPDWGVAQAGLLGIACGAIAVEGKSFAQFRERCVKVVETLADTNLVVLWRSKKAKRKQKAAVECWEKWKRRLDRMACSKDFFYLGTEEGHTHLREKLGRTISPTEGALVKYDEDISREVFQRALHRSEAVEKMLPPRAIPMDWDGEIGYPEEISDTFAFMREGFIEETMATIVETRFRDALDGTDLFAAGNEEPRECSCGKRRDNYPWRILKAKLLAEFDRRPLGDCVLVDMSGWPESAACWRAKCLCGNLYYDQVSTVGNIKESIKNAINPSDTM